MEDKGGPSHLNSFCGFARLDNSSATKGFFKSHSWTQLYKTRGNPRQLTESALDSLKFVGSQPSGNAECHASSSHTTHVLTDSWPQGLLRPTTRVCIYSNYGLDPYWPKYPDSQAARIVCSRSVLLLRGSILQGPIGCISHCLGIVLSDALGLGIGSERKFRTMKLSYKSDIQNLIEAMHVMTSQISCKNAAPFKKRSCLAGTLLHTGVLLSISMNTLPGER